MKRGAMWSTLPMVNQARERWAAEGKIEVPKAESTSQRWKVRGSPSTAEKSKKAGTSPLLVRTLAEGVSFSTPDLPPSTSGEAKTWGGLGKFTPY
ncbi:hypothetical protein FKM82_019616 [Ascaphus truei]